jgi:hypothetical protein
MDSAARLDKLHGSQPSRGTPGRSITVTETRELTNSPGSVQTTVKSTLSYDFSSTSSRDL